MFTVLLYTHLSLFENLQSVGPFSNGSVLINTLELYRMDLLGQADDLGGGMLGALGMRRGRFCLMLKERLQLELFYLSFRLFYLVASRFAMCTTMLPLKCDTEQESFGTLQKVFRRK